MTDLAKSCLSAPIDMTAAPIDKAAPPIDMTVAPINMTAAPIDMTVTLINMTVTLISMTAAQIDKTAAPIDMTDLANSCLTAPSLTIHASFAYVTSCQELCDSHICFPGLFHSVAPPHPLPPNPPPPTKTTTNKLLQKRTAMKCATVQ